MYCIVALVLLSLGSSEAFLFGGPDWNDLKVTAGPNPLSSKYFVGMPRSTSEAGGKNFVKDSTVSGCNGVKNGFLGERYIKKNGDRSIMLLFDAQGTIAGIQTVVPKSQNYPTKRQMSMHNVWNEEAIGNSLTAYFVDPASICTTGRTKDEMEKEGTGDRILIQYGRPTSNSQVQTMEIPKLEKDIGKTKWTKGKCFPFMGQHYWYNVRMDMDCDEFFPYFVLYNGGKLDSFGFAMATNMEGERFEHPTKETAKSFFPFMPPCMYAPDYKQGDIFTTVHIYMYKRPWTSLCLRK